MGQVIAFRPRSFGVRRADIGSVVLGAIWNVWVLYLVVGCVILGFRR
jgi:hypothetical protein